MTPSGDDSATRSPPGFALKPPSAPTCVRGGPPSPADTPQAEGKELEVEGATGMDGDACVRVWV